MRREIVIGSMAKKMTPSKASKVVLSVELSETDRGTELAICGEIWNRAGTDIEIGGQCVDHLATAIATWAPGWTNKRLARVVEIWKRWHLNGMRAECEHQRTRGETWRTHPSAECPDCGYKLGHAWLYEPIPAGVLAEIRALITED